MGFGPMRVWLPNHLLFKIGCIGAIWAGFGCFVLKPPMSALATNPIKGMQISHFWHHCPVVLHVFHQFAIKAFVKSTMRVCFYYILCFGKFAKLVSHGALPYGFWIVNNRYPRIIGNSRIGPLAIKPH